MRNPLLKRVVGILSRRGVYSDPPAEMMRMQPDGNAVVEMPRFVYRSRIDMAIQAAKNADFMSWLEMVLPMVQAVGPEPMIDNVNFDRAMRELGDNQGVDSEFWNTEKEREQIKEARAQQQQLQLEMQAAETAGKLPESMMR